MKIKRMLFGPDWRSKDADTRLRAVANDRDPELEQQLSLLAREDEDPRIRLAALKRLDDPRRYMEAARDDVDDRLREQARDLALRQLAGERPSALDLSQRELLVEDIRHPGDLEALARTAREASVRRAALARVRRQQVLIEAAIGDGDATLRLEVLARIEDIDALQRVAEATRRTDKRVHRAAVERIEARQLAADDPAARRQQCERLCVEAEGLMRRPSGDLAAALARLRANWQPLAVASDDPLHARFHGALEVIERLLHPAPEKAPEAVAAAPPSVDTLPSAQPAAAAEPVVADTAPAQPEKAPPRSRKPPPVDCSAELTRLATLLAEGQVKEARRIEAGLHDMRPRGEQAIEFGELRTRLAEMIRWQRWSMRDQRSRICADVESLIDSGMHPDALAHRIRELREQWKSLDSLAGEEAPEGITRRFHALCHRALKPARGFFEKREALRSDFTETVRALLADIENALASPEPGRLRVLRRRAGETLRDAAKLSAAERPALVASIKQALGTMDRLLDAAHGEVLKRKKSLLAEAEALAGADPAGAVAEVKRLQAQWKAAGSAPRRQEEPLWKRFRAACDAVFSRLDSRRAEREAEQLERKREAQALVDRVEAIEGLPEESDLREIGDRWRGLDVRDRELVRRFDAARAALDQRREAAHQAARRARIDELLARAETRQRETAAAADATEQAADVCVRLEFLAGIASPTADRQRRMDYQVARLAQRMAGAEAGDSLADETEALIERWSRIGIGPDAGETYVQRVRAALDALLPRL